MPLGFNPVYLKAIEPLIPTLRQRGQGPEAKDIATRRANTEGLFGILIGLLPGYSDVVHDTFSIKSHDGVEINVVRVRRPGLGDCQPTPAVIHAHGGGLIAGSASTFSKSLDWYAHHADIQFFSVEYRLAPEHHHPCLVEDCYAALMYISKNAETLNVDPTRLGVMGESAGGGIVAGTALMARDRGLTPPLAKQILIYPMLDDRNLEPNEHIEDFAVWKSTDNAFAWKALLGSEVGKGHDVSPYAAPARAQLLTNMPPTYIDVGELDIFKSEDIEYGLRLSEAGIPTEMHLYPGVPHAFELFAPNIDISVKAMGNRLKALLSI